MSDARSISLALPGGRWLGSYGMAPCVCHDDGSSPALKLRDAQNHDDGIDVHCFAGCDWRSIKAELRRRGLLGGRGSAPAIDETKQRELKEKREREKTRMRDYVTRLWGQCVSATGTPAHTYLADARGLRVDVMPDAIRFHHSMRHVPTGLDLPAMVAAASDVQGRIIGLHRTFLKHDGSGKAPISQNRMMLGDFVGGAVRLSPISETLAIGEGIETTLAGMQLFDLPGWASLSTSMLRYLVLPPDVESVVLLADMDGPGISAADAAAQRLKAEGRTVRIKAPFSPHKDFADQLADAPMRHAPRMESARHV